MLSLMGASDSRVRSDGGQGRSLQESGNHHRERGRHQQQCGHAIELTEKAAGQVLNPSDHGWSNETTEIADRVDGRNASGGRRTGQEEYGHTHCGGLAALMPALTSTNELITATAVFEIPARANLLPLQGGQ